MNRSARWLGCLAIGVFSTAASLPPTQRNFVACPIVRDTDTVPCWLAEYEGELYYLGIQSDVTEAFLPPYLGYKAMVEGTLSAEPRICGGVVLNPVHVSVMRDPDPSCNVILPAEPQYQVPFANRGPGPREVSAILRPRAAPPPPPEPPFKPLDFEVAYDFDRQIFFGRGTVQPLQRALNYAELADAERIEVVGHRGAAMLSDGSILPEQDGIARIRAEQVEDLLLEAGFPKDKLVVSWSEDIEPLDGVNDFKKRRTAIRVFPK